MVEKNAVESWYALYRGTLLAAHERPGGDHTMMVTEGFAEQFGRAALIAVFVEDQLAVRPPISQAEVDELKRRLGVTGQ